MIEVGLAHRPRVVGLIHHEHAEPVAGVQHGLADRVVRAPERVEPGLLEQLHAPFVRAGDGRRADDTVVVVDAGAAQLDRLAVDPQSVVGIELERADPEGNARFIADTGGVPDGDRRSVERRRIDAPQSGTLDVQPLTLGRGLARQHGHPGGSDRHRVAAAVAHLGDDIDGAGRQALVLDDGGDLDDRAFGVDVGRGHHPDPVQGDMDQVADDQVGVTADAGARVPAGILGNPALDPNLVVGAVPQEVVGLHGERGVARGTLPGEIAVEVDHRLAVDALELQRDPLAAMLLRQMERLLVRIDAGEERRRRITRGVRVAITLDHGVVRERDRLE